MENNNQEKIILNDESLSDVTGAGSFQSVCPSCGWTFYNRHGHIIGNKMYCRSCWEQRDELHLTGAYKTENGAAGSW